MAKEFKEYDKRYAKFKGKLTDYEYGSEFELQMTHADEIKGWPRVVKKYSTAKIRDAVYLARDAEEWQKFRVSLKGFNTYEKLARLDFRLKYYEYSFREDGKVQEVEQIRVDNYLGALVRGGQLNINLEVIR